MFSSINFSSLLPSGLGLAPATTPTQDKPPVVESVEDNDTDAEDNAEKSEANKDSKSGKKKEKPATETFVFVRPPPAKNNHPLNLQVQLVPPRTQGAPTSASNSAAGTPRHSTDTDRDGQTAESGDNTEGAPLSRTPSSVSAYSQFSAPTTQAPSASTASFSSFNSTASSGSRRVIIPLYNLQAHNVMTNTIVDAGTDAKIARFTKKGLEMVELGMLECTEVWATKEAVVAAPATMPSGNSFMSAKRLPPPSESSEPASSNTSLSSSGIHSAMDQPTPTTSKRQAFRNLFSSKGAGTPTPTSTPNGHLQATPRPSDASAFSSPQRHSKRLSTTSLNFAFKRDRSSSPNPSLINGPSNLSSRGVSPRASIDEAAPNTPTPQQSAFAQPPSGFVPPSIIVPTDGGGPQSVGYVTSKDQILLPATLGIQPTLNSLLPFPIPFALVNNERGSDRTKVQLPTDVPYKIPRGPAMYVWIVRRWLKQSFLETPPNLLGINLRGFNSGDSTKGAGKGMTEVEVRFEWTKRSKPKKSKKAKKGGDNASNSGSQRQRQASKRMSIASVISISSEGGPGDVENDTGYDSGEESEPEDSETPWNCVVKVRRVQVGPPGEGGGSVVKLKLGALSPTPHHPKVVGMLKVPYPMPDIHFLPANEGGVVLEKRKGLIPDDSKGLVLSAEEMKDILCSTGMWLVIREGFGGVGRVGRKGDGWRIRA